MTATPPDLSHFLSRLLVHCLDIRAIWRIEDGLLVFADESTLEQLRKSSDLHRADLELLVVTDGDTFENAWGPRRISGSLARWAWRQDSPDRAYYDEAHWSEREGDTGGVVRVRRSATILWRCVAETPTAAHGLRGFSFTPWDSRPFMPKP